jgi:hypothetical protein
MSVTLLILALSGGVVAAFFVLRVVAHGFKGWKFSEKVAVAQAVVPFAAATFALNALFGSSIDTASKIVAAVLTLIAGLLSIVGRVASTLESHPRAEFVDGGVGLGEVLRTIVRG